MDMSLSKLWEIVKDREACRDSRQPMGSQRAGHDLVTEQQQILCFQHMLDSCVWFKSIDYSCEWFFPSGICEHSDLVFTGTKVFISVI